MLFNSFTFLLFLPLMFALYWALRGSLRLQNALLLVGSYVFYGWWDWRFLFLITAVGAVAFVGSRVVEGATSRRAHRAALTVTVLMLLAGLFYFKYFNFFSSSLRAALAGVGIALDELTLDVVLPVGISFYTFQAIGYVVDVYRGKTAASRDVVAFFVFIGFFPQLVAGPIERSTNLYPQFLRRRTFDYDKAREGCQLMLWGFFKKIVIADGASHLINPVWNGYEYYGSATLAVVAVLFAFQIYGDFSGYSDIAIGTAKLFGFDLRRNFDRPFLSRNVTELWRRWHQSLNSWFVDYVYIPLGGSRNGLRVHLWSAFAVFMLSGLWHGANWTFVCWGLFFYLLIVPAILRRHLCSSPRKERHGLRTLPSIVLTFIAFVVGFVIFRSPDMTTCFNYFARMFSLTTGQMTIISGVNLLHLAEIALAIIVLMSFEVVQGDAATPIRIASLPVRWVFYMILTVWIAMFYTSGQEFIYFQF